MKFFAFLAFFIAVVSAFSSTQNLSLKKYVSLVKVGLKSGSINTTELKTLTQSVCSGNPSTCCIQVFTGGDAPTTKYPCSTGVVHFASNDVVVSTGHINVDAFTSQFSSEGCSDKFVVGNKLGPAKTCTAGSYDVCIQSATGTSTTVYNIGTYQGSKPGPCDCIITDPTAGTCGAGQAEIPITQSIYYVGDNINENCADMSTIYTSSCAAGLTPFVSSSGRMICYTLAVGSVPVAENGWDANEPLPAMSSFHQFAVLLYHDSPTSINAADVCVNGNTQTLTPTLQTAVTPNVLMVEFQFPTPINVLAGQIFSFRCTQQTGAAFIGFVANSQIGVACGRAGCCGNLYNFALTVQG